MRRQTKVEDANFSTEPVWPVKSRQMSLKVAPKNDFTRKMKDFDTFTKIP